MPPPYMKLGIITLIALCFCINFLNAQISCDVGDEPIEKPPKYYRSINGGCNLSENYVPNVNCGDLGTPSHRPMITVRVNFHFVQDLNGENNFGFGGGSTNGLGMNYPQSYLSTACTPVLMPDDSNFVTSEGEIIDFGLEDSFNAIHISEKLLSGMNYKVSKNEPNPLWPVPLCVNTQIRFELYTDPNDANDRGVYVHQSLNNTYAFNPPGPQTANTVLAALSVHGDKVIDIFFSENGPTIFDVGGRASTPNTLVEIGNLWKNVLYSGGCDPNAPAPSTLSHYYGLIVHEIGHILLREPNSGHSFNCPDCSDQSISPIADIDAVEECNSGTYEDKKGFFHTNGVGCPADSILNPCFFVEGCDDNAVDLGNGCCCRNDITNDFYGVKSNNVMGYNGQSTALTPCQLGMIHFHVFDNSEPKGTASYIKKDYCTVTAEPLVLDTPGETILWNSRRFMNSDIIIMPGTTLELCCELGMPENGKIIVKQGARFVIHEGTITNPCGAYWDGIYLEGNKDYLHADMFDVAGNLKELAESCILNNEFEDNGCYPGTLVMEGGLIEKAVCGVRTVVHNQYDECYEDPHSFGGLILASESTFTNNNKDVAFMQYEHENLSRFTNCTFERTHESFDFYEPHVTMWDVNGVRFDGCTFNNGEADLNMDLYDDNVNYDEYNWKQSSAIYSIGAGYEVVNGCNFNNYGAAIKISSTSYTNDYPINISGDESLPNTFTNNWVGILAESSKDLVCQENRFVGTGVFDAETNNFGTGIAINGSSHYRVLDNEFEHLREGVIASNTETVLTNENHILRNNFTDMYGSIAALGQNGQLFLDCNDFNSTYDISLESLSGLDGSIKSEQGTDDIEGTIEIDPDPVSNRFTEGCTEADNTHFYGEKDNSGNALYDFFTYYYPDNATDSRLIPTCDFEVSYTKEVTDGVTDVDACNNFGGIDPDWPGDPVTKCPDQIGLNCLDDVRDEIGTIATTIENGEDYDLATSLSLSPTAYSTYQNLKEASPYLGEEIIEDLILSPMDDYLKGDILIDNSPLSDAAMVLAGNHTSDFVYQILYTIKYNESTSAIRLLNIYLDRLQGERDIILQSLIKEELDNQSYETAMGLPDEDEKAGAIFLIHQLIEREEYEMAEQAMEAHLSDEVEDQALRTIYEFNRRLKEEGHCDLSLTSEEENTLLTVAELGGVNAGYAKSILRWLYDYDFEVLLPQRLEPTAKSGFTFKEVEPLAYQSGILISPNPTKGSAYLHAWQNVQGGSLEIYELNGDRVAKMDLSNSYLNSINVGDLKNGIYIAVLLNASGSKVGETKLVVVQ